MRKLVPYILGLAAITWIVGGTVWYKNRYCDYVEPSAFTPVVVLPVANETTSQTTPFYFAFGETQALFLNESLQSFKKTVDYLSKNNDKSLIVKGFYSPKESKLKPNTDLGLERAETIKNVLKDFGAPEKAIEIASEKNETLHFVNNQLIDGIEFTIVEAPKSQFEALNIYYPVKKFQFKMTDDLDGYFSKLKQYLSTHSTAQIDITAHTLNTEGGRLGTKRLNFLKRKLAEQSFKLNQFHFNQKNQSQQPISLENDDVKNQRIEIRLLTP